MSQFLMIDGDFAPGAAAQVQSGLRRILREGGRSDSIGIAEFARIADARLDSFLGKEFPHLRSDAAGGPAAGGTLGAGALRHVYNEVLKEEHPLPNGLSAFAIDTSVPLGAKTHQVDRVFMKGEVRTWRGANSEIPTVNMSQASKEFPVRYYVTKLMWDIFEELAESFANTDRLRLLMEGARGLIEQYANQKVWFGDDANGIYGVLNYPYITRLALNGPSGKAWDLEEDLSTEDTSVYVRELVRMVTYPSTVSKSVFRPNRVAMGEKLFNFLAGTLVQIPSSLTPISLLDRFLTAQSVITGRGQIDVFWELDDAYGEGLSACLAYRQDKLSIANVVIGGGIQVMPICDQGFVKWQPLWMAHGGIVMRRVGDNVLAVIDTQKA